VTRSPLSPGRIPSNGTVVDVVVVLDEVVLDDDVVELRWARTRADCSEAASCELEHAANTNPPAATSVAIRFPATLN
jgi:hypothetical protein